jgi:hypothetical protein
MQPVTSIRPSSTCLWRNLHDGATCTTRRRASTSLQARLGNPSQACFHAKQAARSRHVSHADLPPSVLWCNQQTEACMVLRPKPRNHRGDFEAQITKPVAAGFEAQTGKPSTTLVLRLNQETHRQFWGQIRRNRRHQFWGQTGENRRHWFWGQTSENRPSGFEAKPLTNCRPWFWGSTKKLTLLVSTCQVQTAHGATQPLDRPAIEYPISATILGPLH